MAIFDLDEFKSISGWTELPEEFRQGQWANTMEDKDFPGFVLPVKISGKVCWYVIAENQRQWRSIQPILKAFLGPTFTSFDGRPSTLDPNDSVESYLMGFNFHCVVRIAPNGGERLAYRAVERMASTLLSRPDNLRNPKVPTSKLLSDLDMALLNFDRETAWGIYARLREECLLDGLNLSFARMKISVTFRDFPHMVRDPAFFDLFRVSKPKAIANALLEAIWFVYLESVSESQEDLDRTFNTDCKNLVQDIVALEGLPSPWAKEKFGKWFPDSSSVDQSPSRSLKAGDVGVRLENNSENSKNTEGDFESLNKNSPATEHSTDDQLIQNWFDWLETLAENEQFRNSAEDLLTTSVSINELPKLDVEKLEERIFNLDNGVSTRRFFYCLPQFISWLRQHPEHPTHVLEGIYNTVFLKLVESEEHSTAIRDAIAEMFAVQLALSPDPVRYRTILADLQKLVPQSAGRRDVFWLLDLADIALDYSSSDDAGRNTFLNAVLGSIQPISTQLTSFQKTFFNNLAQTAGWEVINTADTITSNNLSDLLSNKLVGIYTLVESAAREAKKILQDNAPGIRVEVSSDGVCTPKLSSLSRNADYMIVTSLAAKHPATDCIRGNRPAEKIIYAPGKGRSSIIRSLEMHLLATAP